jgi:hypothetical protein
MSVDLSAFGWPEIGQPYDEALKNAVSYLLDRFDVLGVTACGTIVRGTPDVSSDLDIYVINSKPFRQRVQRFFNGVPAEFFINPLHQIRKYFSQERADSRPMTAHMIATGFVMYDPEGLFGKLQAEAHSILSQTPEPLPNVTQKRYDIALLYEDAMDVIERDHHTARLSLNNTLWALIDFYFVAKPAYLPRTKDILLELNRCDAYLHRMVLSALNASNVHDMADSVGLLLDRLIHARGFFEWESEPEVLESQKSAQS